MRMNFLKRHLKQIELLEISPKLSVAVLGRALEMPQRILAGYRDLEAGIQARQAFLDVLAQNSGVFIYERDQRKLSQNLNSFDAFICAYTALLSKTNQCVLPPKSFPVKSGWIQYPS